MTNPYPGSNEPNPYPNQPVPPPPGYTPPPPGYAPPPPGYAPPPPGYAPPPPGYAPPYGGAPMAAGYAPMGVIQPANSGLALASMIVALVSICASWGIGGLVAVILGHMALNQINRSGGAIGGRGQALTGLIIGYILIALTAIFVIFFIIVSVAQVANPPQQ